MANQATIDGFVADALSALEGLFVSFESCREEVVEALYDHIDREVVDTFVTEAMESIDELATHHTIDEVYTEELEITGLDASFVRFRARGSLGVELQWGSGSDIQRGEGASMRESFPFELTMAAPVDNVTAFQDVHYSVDVREWFGGD